MQIGKSSSKVGYPSVQSLQPSVFGRPYISAIICDQKCDETCVWSIEKRSKLGHVVVAISNELSLEREDRLMDRNEKNVLSMVQTLNFLRKNELNVSDVART